MTTHYLIPCSCGQKVRVELGQAGSQVRCVCGNALAVPSIRGLRQLETESKPAKRPQAAWSPIRGTIFSASLFIGVVSLAAAAYYGYLFYGSRPLDDPAKRVARDQEVHIDSLSPLDSLAEFRLQEQEGLGEPQTPFWVEMSKFNRESGQKALVGLAVAVVALILSGVTMIGGGRAHSAK
jgi:hypothetical protein